MLLGLIRERDQLVEKKRLIPKQRALKHSSAVHLHSAFVRPSIINGSFVRVLINMHKTNPINSTMLDNNTEL